MKRLLNALRLLNLNCEAASALISQSLDRDLSRFERYAIRTHLAYCGACRRYKRQVERLHLAMREASEHLDNMMAQITMPANLRQRLKKLTSRDQ